MRLGGIVLDLYDDPKSLTEIYASREDLPESTKTAHALSSEELQHLPDDVFALVLNNGASHLRKYACIDQGNTELNVAFFLKHAHKLPEEAQKVAAQNLITACGWYDVEPPEALHKIAIGLGQAAQLALVAPSVVKGTSQKIHSNLAATRALEGPGGQIGGQVVPPAQRDALLKGAEASGTPLLPLQEPGKMTRAPSPITTEGAQKSAGMSRLVPGHKGDHPPELETTQGQPGEQYKSEPQSKVLTPHVNVANKEAPKLVKEKTAEHYALGGCVYPLDSYSQVKRASQYFDEHSKRFSPAERHEYCVNLVKRASVLGIEVSEEARKYGSEVYASVEEMKVAHDMRLPYMDGQALDMLNGLFSKRGEIPPDVFCDVLSEIDKIAMVDWMYDDKILDPYASTFGFEKTAENESWINGNDYITRQQITNFGKTGFSSLTASYGDDFAKEFQKDPWAIFSSLPLDQKRRLSRMAKDNSPTGKTHVA